MGNSCVLVPQIEVNGSKKDSRLFKDLLSYTNSREDAKKIWALTKIKDVASMEGIELDDNGEPTIESLKKVLNLESSYPAGDSVANVKKALNAVDKKGNAVVHKTTPKLFEVVIKSNRDNPKTVASVHSTEEGTIITVEPKTSENHTIPEAIEIGNALNTKLQGILNKLGFDVAYTDNPRFAAMFSPEKAETNAKGLKTVIRIAHNQEGQEAFPEEFAHLMIEGLQHNPMVQRLLRSLSDIDVLKEVLGDEYQKYVDLYNGEYSLLQKEAAGKLLGQYIKNQNQEVDRRPLLSRIWGFIKDLLLGEKTEAVDNAISEARSIASQLSKSILKEELLDGVDKLAIDASRELYAASTKLEGTQDLLQRSIEIASRRMKLLADRSKSKRYDSDMMDNIKRLNKYLDRKEYVNGCISFMVNTLDEAKSYLAELKGDTFDIDASSDTQSIARAARMLRRMKEFIDGYTPIIDTYRNVDGLRDNGEVDLTDSEVSELLADADQVSRALNKLNKAYTELRYNTVFSFLKNYFGEDKIIKDAKGKETTLTLKMILDSASKDIGFIDRYISSMSDASDPLLSLIDKAVKDNQTQRDEKLQDILSKVRAVHDKLMKSGNNTDFMYERNEEGKLTGYIISDIDWNKYRAEKQAFVDELNADPDLKYMDKVERIEAWERGHKPYIIDEETGEPIINTYYKVDKLSKLNKDQREYYDSIMSLKRAMDSLLPENRVDPFKAPQIRNDVTEAVANNITDPKKAVKLIKDNLKDSFVKRKDDTEFGEDPTVGNVTLDFAGNIVLKLPIAYTQDLEDMDRLSTDFTSSMLAYSGMAVNYHTMAGIVDVLEVARDLVHDREVQQTSGGSDQVEVMKVLGKTFSKAYTLKGNKTNISKRIDDYYESVIYGKKKKDEGTIAGSDVSTSKTLDSIKNYTGIVGLGLNLFAGISNVVQGKLQMFFEGVGGEYFGMKDLAISGKQYYQLLPEVLGELNSPNKKSKLGLLIDKYNALEEFYSNLQNTDYYKSPVARIIGNTNWFILNNLGEHYLHSRNMLAILNNIKVKDASGKEISMYDAYEVYTDEDGATSLRIKKGVTTLDGTLISTVGLEGAAKLEAQEAYTRVLSEQRNKIGKVNQSMNGAFNEDDKGAIHRNALGRMAMQFRQWMPAHYSRRFAGKYFDAALNQQREGYYRTFGRFFFETMQDLARGKVSLATNWSKLNNHEKANIRRAITELATFGMLCLLVGLCGSEKDKKTWTSRMAIYQLKRAKLETGASVPWFSFFDNGFQILKSPSASINTVDNLIDLFKFHNMFVNIDSGRYKGWSKYEKDVAQIAPLYGQVRRWFDLKTENYMFQTVNN